MFGNMGAEPQREPPSDLFGGMGGMGGGAPGPAPDLFGNMGGAPPQQQQQPPAQQNTGGGNESKYKDLNLVDLFDLFG